MNSNKNAASASKSQRNRTDNKKVNLVENKQSRQNKLFNKLMQVNKKNLADGHIHLHIDQADIVHESEYIEYRDYDREDLERPIERQSMYLENVKNGRFSKINTLLYQKIQEIQRSKFSQRGHVHQDEYQSLISEINEFILKSCLFFQGCLCGIFLMHLILIFVDTENVQRQMLSYSLSALKMNQVFQIFTLISLLGSMQGYLNSKKSELSNIQDQVKYLIPAFCFLVIYVVASFNHLFIVKISHYAHQINQKWSVLENEFNRWRILNIIQTFFAFVGWITYVIFLQVDNQQHSNNALQEEEDDKELLDDTI